MARRTSSAPKPPKAPPTRIDPHILRTADAARSFILAGKAFFTVRNPVTGNRFTYRVKAKKDKKGAPVCYFVAVLTGPDNNQSYTYLGTIFAKDGVYKQTANSKVAATAMSAKAFDWIWRRVGFKQELTHGAEIWHDGKCGCCGRRLTVPESIASGIGPVCATR